MSLAHATKPTGRYFRKPLTASEPNARYNSFAKDDYVSLFQKHLRTWRSATLCCASATEASQHPEFQKIVNMGSKVVPLIISELRVQPDLLIVALPLITGQNPVPDSDRGNLSAMANAWIQWHQTR